MASMIARDVGRPSSGRPEHTHRPSRLVLLLACLASAAVVGAAAADAFTPLLALGAMAAACCIAAIGFVQGGRGVVAGDLAPLAKNANASVTIDAPRASESATGPVSHTDAA